MQSVELQIYRRIHIVYVFLVQFLPKELNRFPKALEMDNLAFPEEFDDIVDIWIIAQTKDIVISHPGFLFWFIT